MPVALPLAPLRRRCGTDRPRHGDAAGIGRQVAADLAAALGAEAQGEETVGVLGDLFLDRYLDIDPALNEPSVETGLTAHQVTKVRSYPGAAGTVITTEAAIRVPQGRSCGVCPQISDTATGAVC